MEAYEVAVKVKGNWRFFDPAATHLPYGVLRWQEEGSSALVSDSKEPEKSVRNRRAILQLAEDGTIEGFVHLEYTGHAANARRADAQSSKPEEREESFKSDLKDRTGEAPGDGISRQTAWLRAAHRQTDVPATGILPEEPAGGVHRECSG